MNLKNNYVIKSLKSRPVLFSLTAILSSMLTSQVMSTIYRKSLIKEIREREKTISLLKEKISSLNEEISSMKTEIKEVYDPKTGKIIKRETRREESKEKTSKKESSKEKTESKEIEKEKIVKKIDVLPKNTAFVGAGMSTSLDKYYLLGYSRRVGVFKLGVAGSSSETGKNPTIFFTLGIDF